MDTSYPSKATPMTPIAWFVIVAIVIALIGLIFFGIVTYLKQQLPQQLVSGTNGTSNNAPQSGFGQGPLNGTGMSDTNAGNACVGRPTLELSIGGRVVRSCGRPTRGQVTAVSATSITVQPTDGSAAQTFTVSADTNISDNGNSATPSDIAIGDTVAVIVGDDATKAQDIIINAGTPTLRMQTQ